MKKIHPKYGIAMTALQYADEWKRSAEAFFSAGHYNWMNEKLGEAKSVIEVGCGSGASTEVLAKAGRKILVIESNQRCVDIASNRLKSKDIEVEIISLDQLTDLLTWSGADVKFLVEDVLSGEVEKKLPHKCFDAIICWMIGSNPEHIGLSIGKPFVKFEGTEMPYYRAKVQERCYELGVQVMSNKGIVHIVDRAAIRNWECKDQMQLELATTIGMAAGTRYSVSKSDCSVRKILEGLAHSSIKYTPKVPSGVGGVPVLTSVKAHLVTEKCRVAIDSIPMGDEIQRQKREQKTTSVRGFLVRIFHFFRRR